MHPDKRVMSVQLTKAMFAELTEMAAKLSLSQKRRVTVSEVVRLKLTTPLPVETLMVSDDVSDNYNNLVR